MRWRAGDNSKMDPYGSAKKLAEMIVVDDEAHHQIIKIHNAGKKHLGKQIKLFLVLLLIALYLARSLPFHHRYQSAYGSSRDQ